jgi:hypothetical protein
MRQGTSQCRNAVFSRSDWQWQPTLTAHDPNPPITLENAAAAVLAGDEDHAVAVLILTQPVERRPAYAVFSADDDIVPLPAAFSPDEDYWLQLYVRLAPQLARVFSADDEIIPKPQEDYWLQLLARQEQRRVSPFISDDEIVPQPAVFVPDEEYGPRFVCISEPQFTQLWVSDGAGSAPPLAEFLPSEDYWQRFLIMEEPRLAQMWVSDGAASSVVVPPAPGVARYIPQWRRRRR